MTSRNAFTRGPTAPALSYARFTPPGNPTPDDAPDEAPDEAATGAALARAKAVLARHVEPPPPPQSAPDPGVILAEIDRGDGTTMRVCWRLFEGKPFVAVGVWAGGWPVKGKQTTVKVRELAAVLDGLVAAVEKRDEARRP